MPGSPRSTLWFDTGRTRFYLVDDDRDLPAGDLRLFSICGEERVIDARSVRAYEVTTEAVQGWLQCRFDRSLSRQVNTASPAYGEPLRLVDETTHQLPGSDLIHVDSTPGFPGACEDDIAGEAERAEAWERAVRATPGQEEPETLSDVEYETFIRALWERWRAEDDSLAGREITRSLPESVELAPAEPARLDPPVDGDLPKDDRPEGQEWPNAEELKSREGVGSGDFDAETCPPVVVEVPDEYDRGAPPGRSPGHDLMTLPSSGWESEPEPAGPEVQGVVDQAPPPGHEAVVGGVYVDEPEGISGPEVGGPSTRARKPRAPRRLGGAPSRSRPETNMGRPSKPRSRPDTRRRGLDHRVGEGPATWPEDESTEPPEAPSRGSTVSNDTVAVDVAPAEAVPPADVDPESRGQGRQANPNAPHVFPAFVVLATLAGIIFAAGYFAHAWMGKSEAHVPGDGQDKQLLRDVARLSSQVTTLASGLDRLEKKVDIVSKAAAPVDLDPLRARLEAVGESLASLTPLLERARKLDEGVRHLEDGMNHASGELASLKDTAQQSRADLASLKTELKQAITELAKLPPNPHPPSEDLSSFEYGAKLFLGGKYRESADAFRRLETGKPQDARVCYFAALAHGAATNDWAGDAVKYVTEGIELERAGKPERSQIDAAFVKIPARFKPWLDTYRQRSRSSLNRQS